MLKKIFLVIVAALAGMALSAQEMQWHNPAEAGFNVINNQAFPDAVRENPYHRLPSERQNGIRNKVWNLSKQSAGECICFTTDAKEIKVRYGVKGRHAMHHMPAIGVSGLDIYTTNKRGEEVWLPGKYSFKDTLSYTYSKIDILDGKEGPIKYNLYLPLYNEVTWMEVGTPEGAVFKFEAASTDKPIVAYGTSICQGACASRPAMAWTNILHRRLARPIVNLGFSGNAKYETAVIDIVSDIDACVYILDGMANNQGMESQALQDTLMKAVRQIRAKRPDTPIIMVDYPGAPDGKAYKKRRDNEANAHSSQAAAYKQLTKEGVKNLYHLKNVGMIADMTVEGTHMSDYGMTQYANKYEPLLRKILKKCK